MARQLFVSKRLVRALPWLQRASWRAEALLVRGLVRLLRALPVATAFALARGTMRALGPLTPMWEKVARNLAVAFPERPLDERRRLRGEIFANLGAAIAELVLAERLWAEQTERFEFHVDPALDLQRPMVLVTGHVGAWQLTTTIGWRFGIPMTAVYAPESNPALGEVTYALRSALPCTWISREGVMKRLLEELRAGRSVSLASDTRLDEGEPVPFFGHPALSNTAPARLALRLGCDLVPVRAERLPGERFRITMEAPVGAPADSEPAAARAATMTADLMARFEGWIRESPGEWMCLARRFPKELDNAARGGRIAASQPQ